MFEVMRRPPVLVYYWVCENLRKDHLAINVATKNVRTLHDETHFKLTNLLNEIERLHMDILRVLQTYWTNVKTKTFQKEQHVIIHSCKTDHSHQQGVAIILKEKLAKQFVDYDLINEQIMIIQLKTVQEPLFVFQVYSPD